MKWTGFGAFLTFMTFMRSGCDPGSYDTTIFEIHLTNADGIALVKMLYAEYTLFTPLRLILCEHAYLY